MFLEAGIFSLQVILQSGQKETLTASLEMQRTRYIFVYTLKERCYSINPVAMLHCFFCHQHESDTRMFYHASKLDRRSDISSIVVDAEDTDVAVIASYASFKFEKELLLYRKKKILLFKQLCPKDMSSVIISLHELTGTDAVSSFYGHSKKVIYEKAKKK